MILSPFQVTLGAALPPSGSDDDDDGNDDDDDGNDDDDDTLSLFFSFWFLSFFIYT